MSFALPVLDRVFDNTAMASHEKCPRLYFNSMVLHRRSDKESAALLYGRCIHTLFEIFYKTQDSEMAIALTHQKYVHTFLGTQDFRTLGRAILVFEQWLDHYGAPDTWADKTLGFPTEPMVELSTHVMLPIAEISYAVRIDRIFEERGKIYVEDHKTTAAFGATFYNEWQLSGQMMGYVRAAELLIGQPVAGIRINTVVTRKNDSEFSRRYLHFDPVVLDNWELSRKRRYELIQRDHADDFFVQNWTACSTKYGMCPYADVCELPPVDAARALITDFAVAPWDPSDMHD